MFGQHTYLPVLFAHFATAPLSVAWVYQKQTDRRKEDALEKKRRTGKL